VDTPITRTRYAEYCSDVAALDRQVGAAARLLDETRTAERTLFLFLSEQGTDLPWGKWTCYEQGLHAGAIVRWPGVVTPGSQAGALVEYVDVVPTLLDAAGGKPPAGLDGKSFLSVLQGRVDRHKQYVFGIHNNHPEGPPYPIRAVRSGRFSFIWNLTPSADYNIKYTMSENPFPSLDYWRSWVEKAEKDPAAARLIARYVRRPEEELYDLAADPWEQDNLAGRREYQATARELRAHLQNWMRQQKDSGADLDQPVEQRGPWLAE
jgi:arylsulfatase A-like enzyme